jgi:hypothetical protein
VVHRFALLFGGTGAAGVLAFALALGGFGAPLANSPDAFAPTANEALNGGQLPVQAPTDQPTMATTVGGGEQSTKVIDTVYVQPAPAVHSGNGGANNQPADTPRHPNNNGGNNNGGNNNGGNQAGGDQNGDQTGDDQGDDQAGDEDDDDSDEDHDGDDHEDDGDHHDDGGDEPGED